MEVVIVRPTRLSDEPEPAVLDPPGKKIQPMAVAGSNARSDRLKRETNPPVQSALDSWRVFFPKPG